ncbi:hypothetical protein ARMGADRAFT_1037956 [Armillaria gallica]|uniref:Uncharacterized protein n=1 Tax=Armillaria gallica TaxID=47427 RepID=A0A2H3CNA9_ARMGA|nr:hypothetical protein ARMGADRAFT_1037956 [Armillaria gallica]
MDIDDMEANPWSSVLTVPTCHSAEDMEADPSAGALILCQRSFQEDMHPAKRQANVNQHALPMYAMNEESMRWLWSQHHENTETINSLKWENMGLWSSNHMREGQLNEAQKAKEQAHKELEKQTNLMKVMETQMKENEDNMREHFSQLQGENERVMRQHLLQLKNAMKQKDDKIVTLNAQVNAASSPMPQASTSMLLSSTGPESTSLISPLSSNSTSGAASSSTVPESSSQVFLSSTRTETTAPDTTSRVIRSPKVGTGRKAVKIVRNNVTLPASPFRTKEQTSGSSCQVPQWEEDTTMDELDEYGFDNATLNNASSKELLKMCAQLLQAAVSGKAQVRKEDVGRKSPSKKTSARMGQCENMSKAEINALQTFIGKQFLTLTGLMTLEEFIAYEPVNEAIMIELRDGTGDGPDDEEFTLDFNTGFGSSKWNHIILAKMTDVVQAELLKEDHLIDVNNVYIEETLQNHLSAARQKWAEAIPCLKKDMLEFETESEVVDRVVETGHRTQTKAQGCMSKNRKYKVRTEIVKKVIFLKTKQKANNLPDGMSSEESHTQVMEGQVERVFLVKICLWRHENIIEYMDEIDERGREIAKKGNKAAQ